MLKITCKLCSYFIGKRHCYVSIKCRYSAVCYSNIMMSQPYFVSDWWLVFLHVSASRAQSQAHCLFDREGKGNNWSLAKEHECGLVAVHFLWGWWLRVYVVLRWFFSMLIYVWYQPGCQVCDMSSSHYLICDRSSYSSFELQSQYGRLSGGATSVIFSPSKGVTLYRPDDDVLQLMCGCCAGSSIDNVTVIWSGRCAILYESALIINVMIPGVEYLVIHSI